MRKRSFTRNPIQVELFPFLSILACTIGTLILLIIVLTTQIFSSQQEVTIIAQTEAGSNQTKVPRYLECGENGVIIYPSQEFVAFKDLSQPNSSLVKLLAEVKQRREQEYLIVAIRPKGIETFHIVRDLIEERGIDLGYEPIDRAWQLKIK